jgi:hypothetical protein
LWRVSRRWSPPAAIAAPANGRKTTTCGLGFPSARLANLPDALLAYRVHGGQTSAGINLGQRFARDLALLAARARRARRPDPLDGAGEALRFDRPFPVDW